MGGINHYPSDISSLAHTVPGAQALTNSFSEFMLGNSRIESAILAGPNMGLGQNELVMAANCFARSGEFLGSSRYHLERVIALVGRKDYQPFAPTSINIQGFIAEAIARGLLPESAMTRTMADRAQASGHEGMFFEIRDKLDLAKDMLTDLEMLTRDMVNGPEGTQGYTWYMLETNKRPWRQRYMQAQTALSSLLEAWSTSAAICTEAHLVATGAPSLLSNANVAS